jgi:hypothetical protein
MGKSWNGGFLLYNDFFFFFLAFLLVYSFNFSFLFDSNFFGSSSLSVELIAKVAPSVQGKACERKSN